MLLSYCLALVLLLVPNSAQLPLRCLTGQEESYWEVQARLTTTSIPLGTSCTMTSESYCGKKV